MTVQCGLSVEDWGGVERKTMHLRGQWSAEIARIYLENSCTALDWMVPDRGAHDAEGLLAIDRSLTALSIRADGNCDDSAVGDLTCLDNVHLLTKARSALDLSGMTVAQAWIDDRPALSGLEGFTAQSLRLSDTVRPLVEVARVNNLEYLTLEASRDHEFDMRAIFPHLRRVAILSGRVMSVAGLVAPQLEHFVLHLRKYEAELDLRPLRVTSPAVQFRVGGPSRVLRP